LVSLVCFVIDLAQRKKHWILIQIRILGFFLPPKEQEMWITVLTISIFWSLQLRTKTGWHEAASTCFGFCISPTSFQVSVPTLRRWFVIFCLFMSFEPAFYNIILLNQLLLP